MAKAGFRKAKLAQETQKAFLNKSMSLESKQFEEQQQEIDSKDLSPTFNTKRRMDPLTEGLNCTSYYNKMRFEFLYEMIGGKKYPMEVSRYYQEIKLAIDIGPIDADKLALKKILFKEHNISYQNLESATDMRNFAKELS